MRSSGQTFEQSTLRRGANLPVLLGKFRLDQLAIVLEDDDGGSMPEFGGQLPCILELCCVVAGEAVSKCIVWPDGSGHSVQNVGTWFLANSGLAHRLEESGHTLHLLQLPTFFAGFRRLRRDTLSRITL
jgi:hypothetical protein